VCELAGRLDDLVQQLVQVQPAGDRLDRAQQRAQPALRPLHAAGPLDELVDELVEFELGHVRKSHAWVLLVAAHSLRDYGENHADVARIPGSAPSAAACCVV
jgi:hypothetical protein